MYSELVKREKEIEERLDALRAERRALAAELAEVDGDIADAESKLDLLRQLKGEQQEGRGRTRPTRDEYLRRVAAVKEALVDGPLTPTEVAEALAGRGFDVRQYHVRRVLTACRDDFRQVGDGTYELSR